MVLLKIYESVCDLARPHWPFVVFGFRQTSDVGNEARSANYTNEVWMRPETGARQAEADLKNVEKPLPDRHNALSHGLQE